MDFEKAVSLIGTVTDLRWIASPHVIDHDPQKDEELKALAEEWSSPQHKNRETPFPLGWLAASGRYDRRKPGKLAA